MSKHYTVTIFLDARQFSTLARALGCFEQAILEPKSRYIFIIAFLRDTVFSF